MYGLTVYYGDTIQPVSFSAQLNGATVSGLFNPVPATSQTVLLNLQPGKNVLRLSVDGTAGKRTATDTDHIEILVP